MIDAKNLSDFLTRNVHPDLYPQFFVTTQTGKLVSYSSPVDIDRIEDQAALVAMAWRDSTSKLSQSTAQPQQQNQSQTPSRKQQATLRALTIETEMHNIIVQPITPHLLLVLVGGLPPPPSTAGSSGVALRGQQQHQKFKVRPESVNDAPYPPDDSKLEDDVVALTSTGTGSSLSALKLQRRKLDKLAETIRAEAEGEIG